MWKHGICTISHPSIHACIHTVANVLCSCINCIGSHRTRELIFTSCTHGMQVFGLFTVVATATGCLYFLDVDDIAKTAGLTAAGVLLLVLNACFVAVMGLLISKRGGPTVIKWIVWSKNKTLTRMNQLLQICWPRSVRKGGQSNASTSSNTGRTTSVQLGLLNRLSGQNQSQLLTGASSSSRQNLMSP